MTTRTAAKRQAAKQAEHAEKVAATSEARNALTRPECITYLQAHGAYSGHSRDSIEELRAVVAQHRGDAERAGREALADLASAGANVQVPEPGLLPDGPDRLAAAKAEHKILHAWIKDGEKPPRPATPNLDAMNADYAAGRPAAERRTARKATNEARSVSGSERVQQARAAAKAGPRGPGKAMTDGELTAWIKQERSADPTVTRHQAQQINWWVDGYAVGIHRFNDAWDAAGALAESAA